MADEPIRRNQGPKALNAALGRLTRPLAQRRGALFGEILAQWTEIVGERLAEETAPERLTYPGQAGHGATLEIAVSGAEALELQHLAPLVVEKINGFFGYRAVGALKLRQMPRPPKRPSREAAAVLQPRRVGPLDPAAEARLAELLAGVADKPLAQALERLGRSLLSPRR